MANVMELLRKIKTAIYGRDVRQSIYDAILQCYQDATGNPESIAAHTGDTNNPHNVTAEQVGLANAAEDISQAKKDISGLKNPEFEDFTAEGSTPPDARTAIAAITSKMSFFTYLSKVKAALMGLVTLGEMRSLLINNGLTTEAGKYFLDAAYGKTLSDLVASNASAITQLNSDLKNFSKIRIAGASTVEKTYIVKTNSIYESFLIFGQKNSSNIFELVNTHNNDNLTIVRLADTVITYERGNSGALVLKIPDYTSVCIISKNDMSFNIN